MNLQQNAENSLNEIAGKLLEDSVFCCRKCWALFENPEQLPQINCPNCSTAEKFIELYAEAQKPWMSAGAAPKRELSAEARQKMSEGAKLPHPRGAQSPEAKARMGGFNYKHGLYAKVRHFARASHGNLAACKTCPFAALDVNPAGDGRCLNQKWTECGYQAVEMLAFSQAILSGKLDAIKELIGEAQAKQLFALRMALDNVIRDGVTVEDVIEKTFGENGSSREERIKLNPAIEAVSVLSRSLGGIGLSDFLLTPKSGSDESIKENLSELINRTLTGFQTSPRSLPAPAEDITADA